MIIILLLLLTNTKSVDKSCVALIIKELLILINCVQSVFFIRITF